MSVKSKVQRCLFKRDHEGYVETSNEHACICEESVFAVLGKLPPLIEVSGSSTPYPGGYKLIGTGALTYIVCNRELLKRFEKVDMVNYEEIITKTERVRKPVILVRPSLVAMFGFGYDKTVYMGIKEVCR